MKILVDAFGGDNAPLEIIKGSVSAREEYGHDIILVGNEVIIKTVAKRNNIPLKNISIEHAEDIVTMIDAPTEILKSKNNSSLAEGLKLLEKGKGDAFISAGNSGALAVGATFIVKRIKGIKRGAFAPVIPKDKGFFMLIDSGANIDCRPEMLNQFGLMGSIYMAKVMNISNPRIGLANVGIESHKGDELRKSGYNLMSESGLNFTGNIEARDIPLDGADVIVADGFTGNIILKMYEGMATVLFKKFKSVFNKNIKTKFASAILMPELKSMKKQFDYDEYGGAPFMGMSKPVFKAHGSANAKTIKNAINLTAKYVEGNVVETISSSILK